MCFLNTMLSDCNQWAFCKAIRELVSNFSVRTVYICQNACLTAKLDGQDTDKTVYKRHRPHMTNEYPDPQSQSPLFRDSYPGFSSAGALFS